MSNEEMALAIQAGDDSLILPLWEQCKGLICKEAHRWARAFENRPEIDVDDLIQSGYFALLNAAQRFKPDPECGTFAGLLYWTLKGAFADACNVRTRTQQKDPIKSPLRLESPIPGDADGLELGDTIADQRNGIEEAEEAIYSDYVSETVHKAVDSLEDRQRLCIDMRYFQGKTQQEISELWNVSGQYVSQVERLGLRRIREGEHIQELSEIYYGSRDYFRGTGLTVYRRTGTSSPERELLRKERFERRYKAASENLSRERKIHLLVEYMDYSQSLAEWMVDNRPEYDYSWLLELEHIESA